MSWVRVGEIQSRHNFEKLKVFSHPRTFLLARNHGVRLLVVVVVIDLVVVVAVVVVVVAVVIIVAVVVVVVVAVVVVLWSLSTSSMSSHANQRKYIVVFFMRAKKVFFSLSQRFFISQNLLFSFGIAFSLKTRAKEIPDYQSLKRT